MEERQAVGDAQPDHSAGGGLGDKLLESFSEPRAPQNTMGGHEGQEGTKDRDADRAGGMVPAKGFNSQPKNSSKVMEIV